MTDLTDRQRLVWQFWRDYQAAHRGVPPTVREAMESLEIDSPNGVTGHVGYLLKKGAMVRVLKRNESRGIVAVNGDSGCCPTCGQPIPTP